MTVLLQIGRRPPDPPPQGLPAPSPAPAPGPPPASAEAKVFRSAHGAHLFVADGSRVYDLPEPLADRLERWTAAPDAALPDLARDLGLPLWSRPRIDGTPAEPPPLASLSLNVMQACNLSCGHCYADEGRFGGSARSMPRHTAYAAVDRLLAEAAPGADVVVGFMGGEPLLARDLVHDVVRYATRAAADAGNPVRFSLTTNLTTVRPQDARLFAAHPFTVTVSLDGDRAGHDALRRAPGGASAYDRLRAGLDVLARHGRPRHLSARVSVTPRTGRLVDVLDHGIGLGFDEVGFAAVVSAPDPAYEITARAFDGFLDQMVECGERALRKLSAGRDYPFGNFLTAMRELHRGTHRPYPCGAGAGYLSASAEGGLYACHRLVDDPAFAMGSVAEGPDGEARRRHLATGHVDRAEPCRSCWARYLCGGGCYHEVSRRGRPGCDYIRGWLAFCLRAYVELSQAAPEFFRLPPEPAATTAGATGLV
ncbi:SPASM domain-containing protein [Streptomyces yangpuensis]|uniref:SPASM domain-containing protein n=1 Tax=Streptomyces yangpuensis TaxID=1648182 RepID=A0ABY5Q4M7_9ACTN|nr:MULTISPECIES: radical SAM protein [Streptomyces]MBZ9599826.1 SPASM domain-containing protein [Streptomyces erythrochromogenes]UUY51387.1 SPASM domain-containing protein [Streptomyces yangpuensis]